MIHAKHYTVMFSFVHVVGRLWGGPKISAPIYIPRITFSPWVRARFVNMWGFIL